MAEQPTQIEGWDLIPSTTNMRQQKATHPLLGEIYEKAERQQLPQIRWSIATTGTLIGDVDVIEPAAAPIVFAAWVKALRLDVAEKHRVCEKELRATGKRDDVYIILKAEEA